MDRAAILADLLYRYPLLLADSGIAATDSVDGLGPILDRTQALATANPTFDADVLGLIARYLALDLICERLAAKFNITTGGDSFSLQQEFTNAKALRDSVKAEIGWAVEPGSGGGIDDLGIGEVITVSSPYLTSGVTEW